VVGVHDREVCSSIQSRHAQRHIVITDCKEQQHQIFPVIDLSVGPKWELNAGVGLIVKMILGDRFEWGSR
jgi:hypothetical protein